MNQSDPPARADYLRQLGEDVDGALMLIVHDIVATGVMPVEEAQALVRGRASQHLESQSALGLDVNADETAVWVAEAVQEDIIEGYRGKGGRTTWPACPEHPQHPLWLLGSIEERPDGTAEVIQDAAWTCRTSGRVVAELGRL